MEGNEIFLWELQIKTWKLLCNSSTCIAFCQINFKVDFSNHFVIFQISIDDNESSKAQVIVGICAMEKKSLSKPMKEILSRIDEFEYITTTIFPEDIILNVINIKINFPISSFNLFIFDS